MNLGIKSRRSSLILLYEDGMISCVPHVCKIYSSDEYQKYIK